MTDYLTQASLAEDNILLARIAACVAAEGVVRGPGAAPREWAQARAWVFATHPGWDGAVLAEAGNIRTGITDEMIRDAVHQVVADEPAPPPTDNDNTSPAE